MTAPLVLVVDPNPATVRRAEEAFHGLGLLVSAARDADEALLRVEGAPLALVLASAALPRGNGYDLARSLRAVHPQAPVLLMTGGFEVYQRARAEAAGVAGHIAKPFSAAALRQLVESTVGPLPTVAPAGPTPTAAALPAAAEPPPAPAVPRPAITEERFASLLPRDYAELPVVAVDPAVVTPALERAVLEVLPEVVDSLLRNALQSSPAFRELVAAAVAESVQAQLPALIERIVHARLGASEAASARAAQG
jgi:CheY-like chemotaxis protein